MRKQSPQKHKNDFIYTDYPKYQMNIPQKKLSYLVMGSVDQERLNFIKEVDMQKGSQRKPINNGRAHRETILIKSDNQIIKGMMVDISMKDIKDKDEQKISGIILILSKQETNTQKLSQKLKMMKKSYTSQLQSSESKSKQIRNILNYYCHQVIKKINKQNEQYQQSFYGCNPQSNNQINADIQNIYKLILVSFHQISKQQRDQIHQYTIQYVKQRIKYQNQPIYNAIKDKIGSFIVNKLQKWYLTKNQQNNQIVLSIIRNQLSNQQFTKSYSQIRNYGSSIISQNGNEEEQKLIKIKHTKTNIKTDMNLGGKTRILQEGNQQQVSHKNIRKNSNNENKAISKSQKCSCSCLIF